MPKRRTLLKSASALVALSMAIPGMAKADAPIPVVATFSLLGDMVDRIGGDHVAVTTRVGRDGDTHVYQPMPADARAVAQADILVVNGLEFEGWLDRLAEASGFEGTSIVATDGIAPIAYEEGHDDDHAGHDDHHEAHADHDEHHEAHADHADEHAHDAGHEEHGHDDQHADVRRAQDERRHHEDGHAGHDHGTFDPHAWQSLDNAVIYVDNIIAALAQADPDNASEVYQNRAAYVAQIEALDAEIHVLMEALPADRSTIVTCHDVFQYSGRDFGLTFLAPQGLSKGSEASAQDVAGMIQRIRDQGISAVFEENITDSRLLEQIANETGATVGGTPYPGTLSGLDDPAPTYLDRMRHNATTRAQALSS